MAGFSWISGTLALLLIAGNCVAAVDQNHLAQLVNKIWEKYEDRKMFSIAASIPQKLNMDQQYDADQVFSDANMEEVKTALATKPALYKHGRLVAARPLMPKREKNVHAEYRVLQNFDTLLNNNYDKDHDLLLFYVLQSPCYYQCTNEDDELRILPYLDQIKKWKHYAFVFTDIFKAKNVPTTEEQLRESLEKIGINSGLGLQNIFRCTKPGDRMQCSSCSAGNQVAQYCVSDSNEESTMPIVPVNNANVASAPSSQRGLDNGNGNDVNTGGKDNGRGKGLNRGGRKRRGKGNGGRKRGGKGKGGRKRGGKGKGGRKKGGKGKQNKRKGGRKRGKRGNKRGGKRKRRPNGRRG